MKTKVLTIICLIQLAIILVMARAWYFERQYVKDELIPRVAEMVAEQVAEQLGGQL